MAINTIFFDFGGVIYKTPDPRQVTRWKKLLGFSDNPEIVDMLANPNESQLVQQICLGEIPEDHVWAMMAEKWHINPALIQRFRRTMFSKRQLNRPIFRLMAELNQSAKVAILSNAGDQTRVLMEDILHLDSVVEEIIISAEEGVIKPDPKIFQIAMERMHSVPEQSLLLDDYEVNVQAAREFGMKAVHFISNEQAISMIREMLQEEG